MHKAFLVDIVVCNRVYDKEKLEDIWKYTLVENVSWHFENRISQEKKGQRFAKETNIRIDWRSDCKKRFVVPTEYKNAENEYTIQVGDKILKCSKEKFYEFDFESGELPFDKENSCIVCQWSDNRDGILPHIYIQGE